MNIHSYSLIQSISNDNYSQGYDLNLTNTSFENTGTDNSHQFMNIEVWSGVQVLIEDCQFSGFKGAIGSRHCGAVSIVAQCSNIPQGSVIIENNETGIETNDCISNSPCQLFTTILYTKLGIIGAGFNNATDTCTISLKSDTQSQMNIQLGNITTISQQVRNIVIQSDGYYPTVVGTPSMKKIKASTQGGVYYLFALQTKVQLTVRKLIFDNLMPEQYDGFLFALVQEVGSSISILNITDCVFEQDSTSYAGNDPLNSGLICIAGGSVSIKSTEFKNYMFSSEASIIFLFQEDDPNQYRNELFITSSSLSSSPSSFENITQSGDLCLGGTVIRGTTTNADNKFQIDSNTLFKSCISQNGNGGAINLDLYGQQGFIIDTVTFDTCQGKNGGAIYFDFIELYTSMNITNCVFVDCNATNGGSGGALWWQFFGDSVSDINDTTFTRCSCMQEGNGGAFALTLKNHWAGVNMNRCTFTECATLAGLESQNFGWGGAIFVDLQHNDSVLESSMKFLDLVFANCDAAGQGKNIHICTTDIARTRNDITTNTLITVTAAPDLYTNPDYYQDYMAILDTDVDLGTNDENVHKALFTEQADYISNVYNPFYVDSTKASNILHCGDTQSSACKTMKYIIGIRPDPTQQNYSRGVDNVTVVFISNTDQEYDEAISTYTRIGYKFVVKSLGYHQQTEGYTKVLINTASIGQNKSLFQIQASSLLELCGLKFNNLYYSCANPLFSLTCNGTANLPFLSFIECEFSRNVPNPSSNYISHYIISSTGGILSIKNTNFSNYNFNSQKSVVYQKPRESTYVLWQQYQSSSCKMSVTGCLFENIKQQISTYYYTNQQSHGSAINAQSNVTDGLIILNTVFNNCSTDFGNGGAVYAILNSTGRAQINKVIFRSCKASSGGGLYAQISGGGKIEIFNATKFDTCQTNSDTNSQGSGLYADISGSSSNISIYGMTEFLSCTGSDSGGGVYIMYSAVNNGQSGSVLLDYVSITSCTSKNGGGIYSQLKNQGKMKIQHTNFTSCQATTQYGGGIFLNATGNGTQIELSNTNLFQSCKSYNDGGGIYVRLYNLANFSLKQSIINLCNSTNGDGGGILCYIEGGAKLFIQNEVEISNCECQSSIKSGGGLFAYVTDTTTSSVNSSLQITNDVKFTSCKSGQNGGGIYAMLIYPARLTINQTNFTGCQAGNGAGIYGSFSNTVTNSPLYTSCTMQYIRFDGCYSSTSGGGMYALISQRAAVQISNTDIIGCYCTSASSNGGGMYLQITGRIGFSGPDQLFDISSNVLFDSCYCQGNGGGIFAQLSDMGKLRIGMTTFDKCRCTSNTNGQGGGIYATILSAGLLLQIYDQVDFIDCTSEFDGGGIYAKIQQGQMSISNTTFDTCKAKQSGGGIYFDIEGYSQYYTTTLAIITITNQVKFESCESVVRGGAIYADMSIKSQLFIKETQMIGCKSTSTTSGQGGGIYAKVDGADDLLQISDSVQITQCSSGFQGGAIYSQVSGNNAKLDIQNQVTISQCESILDGGAIYAIVQQLGKLSVNSKFTNCKSTNGKGGAIFSDITGQPYQKSTVQISNQVEFVDCESSSDGGAVYSDMKLLSDLQVSGVKFTRCKSNSGKGGGICAVSSYSDSSLQITDLIEFTNCNSSLEGGAIYAILAGTNTLKLSQITFTNCKSLTEKGGAIYSEFSGTNANAMPIDEIQMNQCQSELNGGGIYATITGTKSLKLSKITFSNCRSVSGKGGGIYTLMSGSNSQVQITDQVEFTNCNSSLEGGGIYS
ncbi:MAG: hypothetical protein EZS28_003373, partial [Streblomastix strix]